tara:strand:+ start:1204 stop:1977 length:774 start_codon:yes stop_codon:yes gene_type:complete
MILTPKIKNKIKNHAEKEMPHECCGFIIEKGKSLDTYPCKNIATDPTHHFKIPPEDYIKCSDTENIMAIYHSHPNKVNHFSLADEQNMNITENRFILYCVGTDEFIDSKQEKFSNYIGKEFTNTPYPGCITLTKNYLKDKFSSFYKGRLLTASEIFPSYEYFFKENLYEVDFKKVIKKFKDFNFSRITPTPTSKEDLQEHDLIVTPRGAQENMPVHLAIYTGNGDVLCHPLRKKSCLLDYDIFFKDRVWAVFRLDFL